MRSVQRIFLCFVVCFGFSAGQFPGSGSSPWLSGGNSQPGGGPHRPSPYQLGGGGKPGNRPSYSGGTGSSGGGYGQPLQNPNYDDPIQPNYDSSYDAQTLPSKLPIQAPNGVIEIYNRVIDDLIKRLENDFQKRSLDPMEVVIRPTPPGPVRVPGHLQKRPFRRPGAALYRGNIPSIPISAGPVRRKSRDGSSAVFPAARLDGDKPSFRGSGKISKGPLEVDDKNSSGVETTPAALTEKPTIVTKLEEVSSEESVDSFLARSDEIFPEDPEDERASRKNKKKDDTEEEEEEDDDEQTKAKTDEGTKQNVDTLIQRYQNKNTNPTAANPKEKPKYSGGNKKKVQANPASQKEIVKKPPKEVDEEEEDDEDQDNMHDDHNDDFDLEPGTSQSAGDRPSGGFYPPGGPPAVPAKPNAFLMGLSRIRRSSDVAVSVDARSAIITARLLVGPLDVTINDSVEPQEKNIKATIPELEAELLLMERHGVVFLQRFTLDRAYGQDIEISIPKSKSSGDSSKKGSKGSKKGQPVAPTGGFPQPSHPDPNHPTNVQQRFQTKMAAHISMEIVKLLRSGNLRVNLMRVAQNSMSKLKLPIQKQKTGKKGKKEGSKKSEKSEKKKTESAAAAEEAAADEKDE